MPDQVGHDVNACHPEWYTEPAEVQAERVEGSIKIKAKAKSFCQTIKTIKNGNKQNFVETEESRLIPLRDSCNGCAQMCLYGFRYFHRTLNVVKKGVDHKVLDGFYQTFFRSFS